MAFMRTISPLIMALVSTLTFLLLPLKPTSSLGGACPADLARIAVVAKDFGACSPDLQ